jgi:Flp pilus assembly protein TadD
MTELEAIKEWIENEQIGKAETALNDYLLTHTPTDETYYLQGNICRKKGDWQGALNNYRNASDINTKSPATHAYRSVLDILNFYNKDMYNQ